MSNARNRILGRLYQQAPNPEHLAERHHLSRFDWSREERIQRFTERMQAVRAEVHVATNGEWLNKVLDVCRTRMLDSLLVSPHSSYGQALYAATDLPKLKGYEQVIEEWKQELFFATPASLTTTKGGIAETGSLIVWPDVHEPRLMSLVPPLHIALLEVDKLYSTFAEAMLEQGWAGQMPTNALLISGPSKSADIERVLAYGVHGPKELVVVLV